MDARAAANSENLADRLLAERRRRGFSQAQAAVEVGTTPQTWGRWEAGSPPQLRFHRAIEEFLNPDAEVVRLLPLAEPTRSRSLTALQEQAVETALTRLAGRTSLSPSEVAFFRSVFAAVGLEWFED